MSVESTTNTNAEEVNSTAIENKDMAVVESVTAEEVAAAEVPEVVRTSLSLFSFSSFFLPVILVLAKAHCLLFPV